MRFDVISLFPELFSAVRDHGVTGRAHKQGLWSLRVWNPRDFTHDVHRTVDDRPYGGGPGMVMMAQPLEEAVQAAQADRAAWVDRVGQQDCGTETAGVGKVAHTAGPPGTDAPVWLMSPTGRRFDQRMAQELSEGQGVVLICGRYEGVDQRFIERCVTHEVSMGDFVLSGGEIPALAIMDSAVRLLPGALNDRESARQDSFHDTLTGLLDSPHYTRPEVYQDESVPAELLSGHHANIALWRRRQSLALTQARRPDLIEAARRAGRLSKADEAFLASLGR